MRRSTVLAIIAAVVVVAAGGWLVIDHHSQGADPTGPIAIDSPMPAMTGRSLSGTPMTSEGYRGRVTVINAWASWCGPCRHDEPILSGLAHRYGSRVRFVGIDHLDDRAQAVHFADEFGVHYPSFYDPSGRFAGLFRYPYIPVVYVVDASGTMRWELLGQIDRSEVTTAIEQVLAASASASPSAQGV
jgi:thiol-disulfide isomerase/thioredoxin